MARKADEHTGPASLLRHGCLPRLIDALLAAVAPAGGGLPRSAEHYFHLSWRQFISPERQSAEEVLKTSPQQQYRAFWATDGTAADPLVPLAGGPGQRDEAEYTAVCQVFLEDPAVARHYPLQHVGVARWRDVAQARAPLRMRRWPRRLGFRVGRQGGGARAPAACLLAQGGRACCQRMLRVVSGGIAEGGPWSADGLW